MRKVCQICGLSADAHHVYSPKMPDGCQCHPGEWGDDVNDPCQEYVGSGRSICARCQHDMGCHKTAGEAQS